MIQTIVIDGKEKARNGASLPPHVRGRLAIPAMDGIMFLNTTDILYCRADRSYCRFFLSNGKKVLASKPLKEYESLLEDNGFFRTHKSLMVNLSHVSRYIRNHGGYVILKDGTEVDVAYRKRRDMQRIIDNMCR